MLLVGRDPQNVAPRRRGRLLHGGFAGIPEIPMLQALTEVAVLKQIAVRFGRERFRYGKVREPRGSGADDPRRDEHAVLRAAVFSRLPALQNDVYLCPGRRLIEHFRIFLKGSRADMKIKLRLPGGFEPACDAVGRVRFQHPSGDAFIAAVMFLAGRDPQNISARGGCRLFYGGFARIPEIPVLQSLTEIAVLKQILR